MRLPHLWTKAVVVFAGLLLALSSPLSAAPSVSSPENFFELRGAYVNAGNTDDQFDAASPRYRLNYGHGYGIAALVGRSFGQLRAAVELDYIKVGPEINFPGPVVQFTTRDKYTMVLGGLYYDFNPGSRVVCYLGGGGGLVARHAELTQNLPLPIRDAEIKQSSFGIFGEIGVSVKLTETTSWVTALRSVVHNDTRSTRSTNVWTGLRFGF